MLAAFGRRRSRQSCGGSAARSGAVPWRWIEQDAAFSRGRSMTALSLPRQVGRSKGLTDDGKARVARAVGRHRRDGAQEVHLWIDQSRSD
jgi:hypothetical protein